MKNALRKKLARNRNRMASRSKLGKISQKRHLAPELLEPRNLLSATPWSGEELIVGGDSTGTTVDTDTIDTTDETTNASNTGIHRLAYSAFLPHGVTPLEFSEQFGESSGAQGASPNGYVSGGAFLVGEVEPNNNLPSAQLLPLGTGTGEEEYVRVLGSFAEPGADIYRLELDGGDILALQGKDMSSMTLLDGAFTELIGSQQDITDSHPIDSPLRSIPGRGSISSSYVIPETGTYYVTPSGGQGAYELDFRVMRPVLESEPIGTKQILFLDFNGATVDKALFEDIPSELTSLTPMPEFLQNWNLPLDMESDVIDAVVDVVEENFDDLRNALNANNGDFSTSGIGGEFDIEIRNSRDHADPFGLPNVSRVIIGGTQEQLIETLGIAQSVDVGNFDTTETAVVLLDLLSAPAGDPNSLNSIPFTPPTLDTFIDLIGLGLGSIVTHEAIHFFGGWHTELGNARPTLIDPGGDLASSFGLGPDGAYGTFDDFDSDILGDRYSSEEGFTGFEHVNNAMAFGLATGKVELPSISGTVWNDFDADGVQDPGEPGLEGWTVFIDGNNNGLLDVDEDSTVSAANGGYGFTDLPIGSFVVAQVAQDGWDQTYPGGDGSHTISLLAGEGMADVNFGNRQSPAEISGVKWHDLDGDGERDPGEPGMEGIVIYLDMDGSGNINVGEPATETGPDGSYVLQNVPPGAMIIREVQEAGYFQTFPGPAASDQHVIDLAPGDVISGINFGNQEGLEYGDLPDSYKTLLASDGARHGVSESFHLGPAVDSEGNGQPSIDAMGDDNASDDEDGVQFTSGLDFGETATITVTASSSVGYLQGWIDFNANGNFDDPGEQIISDLLLSEGINQITFDIPDAVPGQDTNSYARFRYGVEQGLSYYGSALYGEVEDYAISFPQSPDTGIIARDDFTLPPVQEDSSGNTINVLANDETGPGGVLEITDVQFDSDDGVVTIAPGGGSLLFTPTANFAGSTAITYMIEDGLGGFDEADAVIVVLNTPDAPDAVNDFFDVGIDTADNILDVLANDTDLDLGDSLTITGVSTPNAGGSVSIENGNQLRYTPQTGASGIETFTYTVIDGFGLTDTATVTIDLVTLPPLVDITLEVTDLGGTPISAIAEGTNFLVRASVQDVGGLTPTGVFSVFMDMVYDAGLVSAVDDSIVHFSPYGLNDKGSTSTPGLIDEVGSMSSGTPVGASRFSLFSVEFVADSAGLVEFTTNGADSPNNQTTIFGSAMPVADSRIQFGTTSVTVFSSSVVADDDTASVSEDSASNLIDVLDGDFAGPGGGALEITAVGTPNNGGTVGVVQIGGEDFLSYTPAPNFFGTEMFSYSVTDGVNGTSSATVVVTVANVNDNPIARNDDLFVETNGPTTRLFVMSNDDSGPDAGLIPAETLSLIQVGPTSSGGIVTIDGDELLYTPPSNFIGTDTFTYTIQDDGSPALSDTATVTMTVGNDVMVARGDAFNVAEDSSSHDLDVLSNDSINPGGTATIVAVGSTSNGGQVSFDSDSITYTPAADFAGVETFTYTLADGLGAPQMAVVTVTVSPLPDSPDAVDDDYTIGVDTTVNVLDVLINDTDPDVGDTKTITSVSATSAGGVVTIDGGNQLLYTPLAGFDGEETFTYTITDGNGLMDTATVTIDLVILPPQVDITLQVTDLGGTPIASVNEGNSFLVQASVQDIGGLNPVGVFSVFMDMVYNDSLVSVVPNSLQHFSPYGLNSKGSTATPGLVDEVGSMSSASPVGSGVFALWSVELVANNEGLAEFMTNPADSPNNQTTIFGQGSPVPNSRILFGSSSVSINSSAVVPMNDSISVMEDTIAAEIDVLDNDAAGPGGGALEIVSVGTPNQGGSVSIVNTGGVDTLEYTPASNFFGTETFTYEMTDGVNGTSSAIVTVTVTNTNDVPVARDDDFFVATNAPQTSFSVLSNDDSGLDIGAIPGETLSVVGVGTTSNGGSVSFNDTEVLYTPATNFFGTDTFTYTIRDTGGLEDTAQVTVTVGDDALEAEDDGYVFGEDSGAHLLDDVLDNDTPNPGATLMITGVGATSNGGLVTFDSDSITYTPAQDFNGVETFTYTVADGVGSPKMATVTISVTPVNDLPTATDDEFAVEMNTSMNVFDVLVNDSDMPDSGETLTILPTFSDPANGSVSLVNGDFLYTPDADFFGVDTFTYTINDGTPSSNASATVTIDVRPLAAFRLETTTLDGTPVDVVEEGGEFLVNVYVQDRRLIPFGQEAGVFSAYSDILFDDSLISFVMFETQEISLSGFPTGGSFTLDFEGATTDPIAVQGANGTEPSAIEAALEALPNLDDVTVTGDIFGPWTVRFEGDLADTDVTDMTADGSGLTGTSAGIGVVEKTGLDPNDTNDVIASLTYGQDFTVRQRGDHSNAGLIDEAGAVRNVATPKSPTGLFEVLLVSAQFRGDVVGLFDFSNEFATGTGNEVNLFAKGATLTESEIDFGPDVPFEVIAKPPAFSNYSMPADVNGDGHITPIDALLVINELDKHGPTDASWAPGTATSQYFVDVNGDDQLTPFDALFVINELDRQDAAAAFAASGSAAASSSAALLSSETPAAALAGGKSGLGRTQASESALAASSASVVDASSRAGRFHGPSTVMVSAEGFEFSAKRSLAPAEGRLTRQRVEPGRETVQADLLDQVFGSTRRLGEGFEPLLSREGVSEVQEDALFEGSEVDRVLDEIVEEIANKWKS